MGLGTRVRLCLKDLYSQDVVEMIERETRRYEVEAIEHPAHPNYREAYRILWDGFGPSGEMEPEPAIRKMLLADSTVPLPSTRRCEPLCCTVTPVMRVPSRCTHCTGALRSTLQPLFSTRAATARHIMPGPSRG